MDEPFFTFILIISVILGIYTGIFLARIYLKTKIIEYLIFLIFWFFVVYLAILISLQEELKGYLIYWKALETGFIGFFGSLYMHSMQILKNKLNLRNIKILRYFGWIYIIALQLMVFFWQKIDQTSGYHLLWSEKPHPSFEGSGAGILINGNIIYSTSHVAPREIFALISCLLFFVAYWTIQPIYVSSRIKNAHRLWKLASLSGIVLIISQPLWRVTDFNPNHGTILATIISLIALVIIIKYPEAFILTKTQAIRLIELYDIEEIDKISVRKPDLPDEIIVYLQEIAHVLRQENNA